MEPLRCLEDLSNIYASLCPALLRIALTAGRDHLVSGIPPGLRDKFAARLPTRIRAVADAVERALGSPDPAHWEAAGRAAHQLAGTAGSFGFFETSNRLRSLEGAIAGRAPHRHIRSCLRGIHHHEPE